MSLVLGICMVKDEEDVIEDLVRHVLQSEDFDALLVADNMSTDHTWDILEALREEFPLRLGVGYDREPAYFQSQKMTRLAEKAVDWFRGGDDPWIVPMDADEVWYHPDVPLGQHLREQKPDARGVHCTMWNHYVTDEDDLTQESPFRRMTWRHEQQNPLHKVCYRWDHGGHVIEQGNHHVSGVETTWTGAAIRHFPYRSAEHFVRKAINGKAAYDAGGELLGPGMGGHWRGYGAIVEEHGEDGAAAWFHEHFTYSGEKPDMVCDPAPLMRWAEEKE